MSVEADAVTIDYYESMITQIEKHVLERTKEYCPKELALLMSVPGIGKILALTITLEVHDIARFPTRQDFCSYCRLIHDAHTSNGKPTGSAGHKIGNPYLKWAFGEAAVLSSRYDGRVNAMLQRLQKKHGYGGGLSVLAHKFGRVAYHMLKNGTVFDIEKFANG
jgi:transposase